MESSNGPQFHDINDVIAVQGKICIPDAVKDQFGDLVVNTKSLLIGKTSVVDMFEDIDSDNKVKLQKEENVKSVFK